MPESKFETTPRCFIGCEADYNDSDTVIFGAPFDGTVTFRPGSRFAPSQMRVDSYGLETYSPYLDADLDACKIHDAGDLDLPFGNKEQALKIIGRAANTILADGKIPVMIGGEHLVTLPAVLAAAAKYPNLCVVHFDAHTDLRDEYMGEKLSHANVLRRIWDTLGDGHIYQFGIRSGTRDEFVWAAAGHTFLHKYDFEGLSDAVCAIAGKPVYLTIDLDVLDPSALPGTGTPEAGGVTAKELLGALTQLLPLNIVAADVVELAPHYDASGVSTAVACKVLREVLLAVNKH